MTPTLWAPPGGRVIGGGFAWGLGQVVTVFGLLSVSMDTKPEFSWSQHVHGRHMRFRFFLAEALERADFCRMYLQAGRAILLIVKVMFDTWAVNLSSITPPLSPLLLTMADPSSSNVFPGQNLVPRRGLVVSRCTQRWKIFNEFWLPMIAHLRFTGV